MTLPLALVVWVVTAHVQTGVTGSGHADGIGCTANSQCNSGFCVGNVCGAADFAAGTLPIGATCTAAADCTSRWCVGSCGSTPCSGGGVMACVPPPQPDGQSCGEQRECITNNCYTSGPPDYVYVCRPYGYAQGSGNIPNLGQCASNADCVSNHCYASFASGGSSECRPAGFSDTTPPPPWPPPPQGSLAPHTVTFSLSATGDLSDYTPDVVLLMRSGLAASVGVVPEAVALHISAGSVVLDATVEAQTAADALNIQTVLSGFLGPGVSSSVATSLLTSGCGSPCYFVAVLQVLRQPTVGGAARSPASPPMRPPHPPSGRNANDGVTIAVVSASASGSAVAVVALIAILVVYRYARVRGQRDGSRVVPTVVPTPPTVSSCCHGVPGAAAGVLPVVGVAVSAAVSTAGADDESRRDRLSELEERLRQVEMARMDEHGRPAAGNASVAPPKGKGEAEAADGDAPPPRSSTFERLVKPDTLEL